MIFTISMYNWEITQYDRCYPFRNGCEIVQIKPSRIFVLFSFVFGWVAVTNWKFGYYSIETNRSIYWFYSFWAKWDAHGVEWLHGVAFILSHWCCYMYKREQRRQSLSFKRIYTLTHKPISPLLESKHLIFVLWLFITFLNSLYKMPMAHNLQTFNTSRTHTHSHSVWHCHLYKSMQKFRKYTRVRSILFLQFAIDI